MREGGLAGRRKASGIAASRSRSGGSESSGALDGRRSTGSFADLIFVDADASGRTVVGGSLVGLPMLLGRSVLAAARCRTSGTSGLPTGAPCALGDRTGDPLPTTSHKRERTRIVTGKNQIVQLSVAKTQKIFPGDFSSLPRWRRKTYRGVSKER